MTKGYHVKITTVAKRDIQDIWDYIAEDSPRTAEEFIGKLEEKIGSLSSFPQRNPLIPEASLLHTQLYRHLIYQKYRIVYRIDQQTVLILRVIHGAKLLDIAENWN